MANANDIIVTTGIFSAVVILGLGALFHSLKKSPSTPSTGGGRRTLRKHRMRRANNGTRRL